MISFFSVTTTATLWLLAIFVHADSVRVSTLNHGQTEPLQFNSFTGGTRVERGRVLKKVSKSKVTKKSNAPKVNKSNAPKVNKSNAPKVNKSNAPKVTSCNSCYTAADSEAFLAALGNINNYASTAGLVLNICAGQTIDASVYGGLLMTNPSSLPCKKYKLTINCCGGLSNCVLRYIGEYGYHLPSFLYFFSDDPYYGDFSNQVAMSLTVNGITFSTSATSDVADYFLTLPTTLSNCTNTVQGSFKAIGNFDHTFTFNTYTIG
jgi:hypothetical protein